MTQGNALNKMTDLLQIAPSPIQGLGGFAKSPIPAGRARYRICGRENYQSRIGTAMRGHELVHLRAG